MSKSNSTLTAERLREVLDYDPETGVFTRLVWTSNCVRVGDAVRGCPDGDGYLRIRVDKASYQSHRLAWLWVHGEWPVHQIDHINGVKHDNRLINLRDVTQSVNTQNLKRARANNASSLLGVAPDYYRWKSQITADGVTFHLGTFDTPEEAHQAYIGAKRLIHPGCTI